MSRIVQMTPSYSVNDGVGNHIFHIASNLTKNNIENIIVCDSFRGENRGNIVLSKDYVPLTSDVVIYHLSIGSPMATLFKNIKVKNKLMCYQNITPSKFFKNDLANKKMCDQGRDDLKMLVDDVDFVFTASEYSRDELLELGYKNTALFPVYFNDSDFLNAKKDEEVYKSLNDGLTNLLFVGRVVANKKIEDVILSYHYYHELINPNSRLTLVGSINDYCYYFSLLNFIKKNNIKNVVFANGVSFSSLISYYKTASLFLVESEHEGFCVPLLEAMLFDIPVIAYSCAAVPNTMGSAGVLFNEKNHQQIAYLIDEVLTNKDLKATIIDKQRKHLSNFEHSKLDKMFFNMLKDYDFAAFKNNDSFSVESLKNRIISLEQQLSVLKTKSIHLELPPTSNKKVIGWFIVLIKRIVLKMTRFIVRPIRDQQTEVNKMMIAILENDLVIMQSLLKKIEEDSSKNRE